MKVLAKSPRGKDVRDSVRTLTLWSHCRKEEEFLASLAKAIEKGGLVSVEPRDGKWLIGWR